MTSKQEGDDRDDGEKLYKGVTLPKNGIIFWVVGPW